MKQPTEVIADAIAGFMPEGDGGQDGLANLASAQRITDALRVAGWEIKPRYRDRISPPNYPD